MKKKKTLRKKHRVKRKKPLLENNLMYGSFLFFSLFCAAIYFFLFFPLFQTQSITVENTKNLNENALIEYIDERLNKKILFLNSRSIFLFSENAMRNDILKKTSVIKDVSIKKFFPAEIEVKIKEREPYAVWCNSADTMSCFYLDQQGVVFQKVERIPKNFIVFIREEKAFPGKKILEKSCLSSISLVKKELSRMDIEARYFRLPTEKTFEVFTGEGWKIYFSSGNIESEIANLKLIIEKISKEKRNDLRYIDLRFGDRVYYK